MKKIALINSWQLYTALRTIVPVLPVSPEKIRFVILPKRKKSPKKNSSRKPNGDLTYQAYRFWGKPDETQVTELKKMTGACRFLWNRMLADRRELYRQMGTPCQLHRQTIKTSRNFPGSGTVILLSYALMQCPAEPGGSIQ